ncbi:MAG: hypothetical protein HZB33_10110 [Nitrospirae bacterium]|nr:hypothetical protein [Nitrospirota bacterium]
MGFLDWLNSFSSAVKPGGDLIDLLKQTKKLNGAELRITPGVVAQAMVKGRLVPLTDMPLEAEACKNMCHIIFTDKNKAEFEKNNKVEFAFGTRDIGRFKANIVSSEGKVSGTFIAVDPTKQYIDQKR